MSDREIIELCRNKSTCEQGFKILISVYSKKIYWHVRRMVNDHDDANDVVQNCFIKAWKGLPQFREDSRLYTWLYRIASNETISFLKDRNRKNVVPISVSNEQETNSNSAQAEEPWIDAEQLQKNLEHAVNALPDKQKQVFIMRYFEEMKYEQMEEILGTSQGALKASYHHAVKKIENFLKATLNQ